MQICDNLSVSAAPSQHPYPFCPFGTFPPDRGNRPLGGEPWVENRPRAARGGFFLLFQLGFIRKKLFRELRHNAGEGEEGDAQNRKDIVYLGKLPVFNPDGTVKA